MSGVKKVTDVAAKAGKAIDRDGLAKMLVSDEARKEFANLRRTFEDVNHQLQTKFSQVSFQSPPASSPSRARLVDLANVPRVWSSVRSDQGNLYVSLVNCGCAGDLQIHEQGAIKSRFRL